MGDANREKMTASIGQYTTVIDQVYKTFSGQDVVIDPKELRGLGDRGIKEKIEQKFQQQLTKARAVFLQEFRNNVVVVDCEVKKIREELTEQFEAKYGERIAELRQQSAERAAQVQKHVEEIAVLKRLSSAQETYLAAVRHRWG